MRAAAVDGDLRQVNVARQQFALGFGDLAVEHEVLGRDAQQLSEAAMKMEGAEMHRSRDLTERRPAREMLFHESHRRDQPRELDVRLKIAGTNHAPLAAVRL